jgi:hypothetical protein
MISVELQVELAHTQELLEYVIWVYSQEQEGYIGPEFQ